MIKTNKLIVSNDIYDIEFNSNLNSHEELGHFDPSNNSIKISGISYNNFPLSDRSIAKTLLHEIVHAIDYSICFINEENESDMEAGTNLVTNFIINHLDEFIEGVYDYYYFHEFCMEAEIEVKRIRMFYDMIFKVIEDNQELFYEIWGIYNG